MKNWTLAVLLGTAATAAAITLVANPASAASLGTWKFEIEPAGMDPGGTLIVNLLTNDSPIIDPALISDLQGTFTPNDTQIPETAHLIDAPTNLADWPNLEAAGGTVTNNKWLNPTPIGNNGIHLDTGGFAFYYGSVTSTPAANDRYALFYANGQYTGLWGEGQVSKFTVESVPEPTSTLSLLALGTLGAGAALKRKVKPSKSTAKETTKVG